MRYSKLLVLSLLALASSEAALLSNASAADRRTSSDGYTREPVRQAPQRKQAPPGANFAERRASYQDEIEEQEAMPAPRPEPRESTPAPARRNYLDAVGQSNGFDGSYGDDYDINFEGDCCPTGNNCCDRQISAGVALAILRPYFSNNTALTSTTGNGASFQNNTDTQFDFGMNIAPRIWLEYTCPDGLGGRVTYWGFDQSSDPVTLSPATNGFGRISTPTFGTVDTSTTIPGSRVTSTANLELHTFDIEGTKGTTFGCWSLQVGAGLRYGSNDQSYRSQTFSRTGVLQGSTHFSHQFDGAGPTVSFDARRSMSRCGLTLFSTARGSLLFGRNRSSLTAVEDSDLQTAFTTTTSSSQDDVLPVGEIQIGFDWRKNLCNNFDVFWRTAMEGQLWQDAGSASSTSGNVGLFGFNVALGFAR